MPAVTAGFCGPRPPLVPRQPAASRGAAGPRTALDIATAFAYRNRFVHYCAALAIVPRAWNSDLVAGAIRPAGIFPEGLFAVSKMARAGSRPRRVGVRRNNGIADRTEAARLHPGGDRQP